MRKLARRLQFSDEVLHMAIINGLRAPIRMHVAQQGLKSLDDTIKAAKIAEATTASVPDTLTSTLLEMLKTSVQASEKQANELQQLTSRVASLSSVVPRQTNNTQQQTSGTPDRVKILVSALHECARRLFSVPIMHNNQHSDVVAGRAPSAHLLRLVETVVCTTHKEIAQLDSRNVDIADVSDTLLEFVEVPD
jgi:hypothetical protein